MIALRVNGEKKTLVDNSSVADALSKWGYNCEDIAVAINGKFIPRSSYAQHTVLEQDKIEIVAPVQGG